ncbi:MAG: nitrate/sulfonate/bicarbonate ABC transporter ATP-binding protein, partial [Promicromonosporaceae bacterium]|nr:nitrate/sulfonate/bicarbonate ABC transporter ATP-binding protein [Promicromonosporaceae bacterium]
MTEIITAKGISQSFASADGTTLNVLEEIDVTLHEGEIVALLGKSASGKSTLLRILSGLLSPTAGDVRYRGQPVVGANPGVAMVFQSFALMPWLTVQDNVEMGLRAQGVPAEERRERALAAIDQIGLDGFETAYPRELSGGMRQRVGFARALVLRPDVLMMDEPFSALDALTTENLRRELVTLWTQPDFGKSCICLVTHSIEEAVLLADRVLVMSSNPGRLADEVRIDLPRPRDRKAAAFEAAVDRIYTVLTGNDNPAAQPSRLPGPLTTPLPAASVGGLAGLAQMIAGLGAATDLADLADELVFEVDDLLPLVDAARLLGLLTLDGVRARLTEEGQAWAAADIQDAKQIFAAQAVERAPLVRTIVRALTTAPNNTLREDFFRDLLHRGYTLADTEQQLDLAIDWGRYGELFDYDADTGELTLTP